MHLIYLLVDMFYRTYHLKAMIVVIKGSGIFFLQIYTLSLILKGKKKAPHIHHFLINTTIQNQTSPPPKRKLNIARTKKKSEIEIN